MEKLDLLKSEKPARYMGGEMGAVPKENAELRFVLAFPDVYEVGMSHLGLQILYGILNAPEWLAAERVYAPWPDMEEMLRRENTPLATLETGLPLARADILGFTLQYELSYTNILNMLELSGIPLLAAERGDDWPLVIGGGPCAMNPEPLANFFDAFLLGDGEEAALEIASVVRDCRREGCGKDELLARLAAIEGVYIPSFFSVAYADDGRITSVTPLREGYRAVRRRVVADLDAVAYPTAPVIPFLKTVHDRVSIEIARGCTRGCRFCQAGYIYRPVRERSPLQVLEKIDQTLRNSGFDEISLLSLSTGDYGCIAPLLQTLMRRYVDERIAVSLPSLRVGTLTRELVDEVKRVRKTGFTLAPEAGSERLRRVINKGITEEDLLAGAYEVFSAGWRVIKLYFMVGLPTETMDDVAAIIDLARKVKQEGKRTGRGGDINVSVSNFVPKAHTPFQWARQISMDEIRERQRLLRHELKRAKLHFKWHDAPLSAMEGVFARGDRRLGTVLLEALKAGCRFDGWGEQFSLARWEQAFAAAGIDPEFYHRQRDFDEILPWSHLECGVSSDYFRAEFEKSVAGANTPDCRSGCTGCGVCDHQKVMMRLHGEFPELSPTNGSEAPGMDAPSERVRLRFSKTGPMRYLSHLEMITLFSRAVARAQVPIRFSQGFHPHPKFSFATALSVGVESHAEYMDLELAPGFGAERVREELNRVLPQGVTILESAEIPLRAPSLSVIIRAFKYRVTLPSTLHLDLADCAERFLACDTFLCRREKKGKTTEFDLRREVTELAADGNALDIVIGRGKPLEVASAVTGLPPAALDGARIEKLAVMFTDPAAGVETD